MNKFTTKLCHHRNLTFKMMWPKAANNDWERNCEVAMVTINNSDRLLIWDCIKYVKPNILFMILNSNIDTLQLTGIKKKFKT